VPLNDTNVTIILFVTIISILPAIAEFYIDGLMLVSVEKND